MGTMCEGNDRNETKNEIKLTREVQANRQIPLDKV